MGSAGRFCWRAWECAGPAGRGSAGGARPDAPAGRPCCGLSVGPPPLRPGHSGVGPGLGSASAVWGSGSSGTAPGGQARLLTAPAALLLWALARHPRCRVGTRANGAAAGAPEPAAAALGVEGHGAARSAAGGRRGHLRTPLRSMALHPLPPCRAPPIASRGDRAGQRPARPPRADRAPQPSPPLVHPPQTALPECSSAQPGARRHPRRRSGLRLEPTPRELQPHRDWGGRHQVTLSPRRTPSLRHAPR